LSDSETIQTEPSGGADGGFRYAQPTYEA